MPNQITKVLQDADALDRRRQRQIANQVETINRLLDGATYDEAMADLNTRLVEAQVALEEANAEISRLQASKA